MKIALPCPGLEHVQRGFETYTRELFWALKSKCDIHLLKSSGKSGERVHVTPALRRTSRVFDFLPSRWQTEYRRFQVECWSFVLGMIPLLEREKFDVIHFSEVPLGEALKWARTQFGFQYQLLLSNGGPWPPWNCASFDAVQQVSPVHDAAGKEFGLAVERSFLVPYGTDGARLRPPSYWSRAAARQRFGLPESGFVILSLAALNRYHKRVDWLIEEFAKLKDASAFLILAGNREAETNSLESLAAQLLPAGNYRFLQLPYADVGEMLCVSDVMVHCSLDEGFGRVYTEAMGASLPLLSHPHATAQWIIDNPDCMVDMTIPNLLSAKLSELSRNPGVLNKMAKRNLGTFNRFEWNALTSDYLKMYEQVIALGKNGR